MTHDNLTIVVREIIMICVSLLFGFFFSQIVLQEIRELDYNCNILKKNPNLESLQYLKPRCLKREQELNENRIGK